ncbi:MAG: 5'-methylthioadenosine/S-adenosylhomocysteine nucleosidase [Anaerolineales bacterium]|nr:5'-methylthioadenosine/S-adenosylhomocysteine nucleosidase [Anaerolineales bacterium]
MSTLVIIPTQKEYDYFLKSLIINKSQCKQLSIGKLPVVKFPGLGITVSCGGLGKVQFAIHTQYLLHNIPDCELVICAGAAGALVDNLAIGDVVVATETVEHDIHNRFGPPLLPKFRGAETAVSQIKSLLPMPNSFRVHFGPIASGDEDVIDTQRKHEIQALTGGMAVAWEGAGGARACAFNDVPFIEIRGISDGANSTASSDYENHLESVMQNIATLILSWVDV